MMIRPERPCDSAEISRLTYAAFLNHPQHAPGTLPVEHRIVESLREAHALTVSLVAVEAERLVGHVAFSPVRVNGRDEDWFGVGPLSVLPDSQRRGIGSALMLKGIEILRERGSKGCVLVGEPAYYQRFGFRSIPDLRLEGVPPEVFLCLPFLSEMPSGTVTFHEAFGVH